MVHDNRGLCIALVARSILIPWDPSIMLKSRKLSSLFVLFVSIHSFRRRFVSPPKNVLSERDHKYYNERPVLCVGILTSIIENYDS